jgi:hypothetical protein
LNEFQNLREFQNLIEFFLKEFQNLNKNYKSKPFKNVVKRKNDKTKLKKKKRKEMEKETKKDTSRLALLGRPTSVQGCAAHP